MGNYISVIVLTPLRVDLKNEIGRLRSECDKNEAQLRMAITSLTEELKPDHIMISFLSSVSGIKIAKNEFFKNGILIGLSLLVQKFLLKKEIQLERKIYEWMDGIFNKIRYYTHKFSSVGSDRIEKED